MRATYLLFFANLNQWLSAKYLAISGDIFGCHTASKRVDSYWDLLVESREVAKYSKMHRLTPKTLKKKNLYPKFNSPMFQKGWPKYKFLFPSLSLLQMYLPTETNDKAANHFLRKIIIKKYVTIYELSLPQSKSFRVLLHHIKGIIKLDFQYLENKHDGICTQTELD